MPELPEVEVTRRAIEPLLAGRRIARVRTTGPSYFFLTPPDELRRGLTGCTTRTLLRRGKYLVAELDSGQRLLIHLGMTGQLFSSAARSPRLLSAARRLALDPLAQSRFAPDEHTHLQLAFDDGGPEVWLRDVRKLGKVRLLAPGDPEPRLERLGADALAATADALFQATRRRTCPTKSLLLDQAVVAGLGNIYADEALFRAGIFPATPACELAPGDCRRLVAAWKAVLRRAIAAGGSSIDDFFGPDGRDGRYQDERKVYARTGEPCLRCHTPIERVDLGGRGTHFCPRCQPRRARRGRVRRL